MTLNAEEKALKQELMDGIHPYPIDVWPEVDAEISRCASMVHPRLSRRVLITLVTLFATIFLMGAAFVSHWYVFDSTGNKVELTQNEGYTQKNTMLSMRPYKYNESDEVFNPFDWTEEAEYPLGGIPLTGSSSVALIRQAEAGQLVETWNNGIRFTKVKGVYTTDYAEFKRIMENNVLQLSLPKEETLPTSYSRHTLFQAGYYLTPENLSEAKALSSETEDGLETTLYALPHEVMNQIDHVELCWFNAEKDVLMFSVNLTDSMDMLFIADERENASIQPITVTGFEKAVLYECYNEYYEKTERLVFLWRAVDSLRILEMGYNTTAQSAGGRDISYIMYTLDAVGLSEDEILIIVNGL